MTGSPESLTSRSFLGHLLSSFGGALNDNMVRFCFILYFKDHHQAGQVDKSWLFGLAFMLPFLLAAPTAGSVGDRYPKKAVFLGVRAIEIPLVLLAGLSFWVNSLPLMITAVALLGLQSAFFAPAKYAFLPQLVPDRDLERANAALQAVTSVAILGGIALAGMVLKGGFVRLVPGLGGTAVSLTVWGLIVATLGLIGALIIRRRPAVDPSRAIASPLGVVDQIRGLNGAKGLWAPALCVAAFWALGGIAQLTITGMVIQRLGMDVFQASAVMILLALGIAIGSFWAPRAIIRAYPAGTPVVGALTAGVALVACGWLIRDMPVTTDWSPGIITPLWEMIRKYPAIITLIVVAGFGSGLWVVSLNTLIQQRSDERNRSMVLSGVEVLTNLALILAFASAYVLSACGFDDLRQTLIFGTATILGSLTVAAIYRHQVLGWFVAKLTFLCWKVRIIGDDNIPRRGGCIVACNHTSYADGPIVITRLPRRARFLVFNTFFKQPLVGFALRAAHCIPVNGENRNRALVESVRAATVAAQAGEMVGLFPEGKISRSGLMDRFLVGAERISRDADVPVIPIHLQGLYGSVTSRAPRRHWPRLRRRVTMRIGTPLPAGTSKEAIRQAVISLSHQTALETSRRDRRTLATAFLQQARRSPRGSALADMSGDISRIRLGAAALSLAPLLEIAGDEARVGVLMPTGKGGTIVNLALAILGRTAVNLNHTVGEAGLKRMGELAGLKTVITAKRYHERIGSPDCGARLVDLEELVPRVSKLRTVWNMVKICCLPASWLTHGRPDDVACIVFSSGSTGDPKGVQLTHRQILANIDGIQQHLGLQPDQDRLLNSMPLFHSFGLSTGTWLPLVLRLQVIAHPDPTDARALGKLAETWRPTLLISTATFARGYLRRITPEQFSSLRSGYVGAEKCPQELREVFKEKYGADLYEGYGCTELAPAVSFNQPDYHGDGVHEIGCKPGSVGRPLPGIEVVTIDPETHAVLPQGASGLLLVRSPARMAGYLDRDDLTAEAFIHDGYNTGDIGHVDGDGFIFITGRQARFAKIGGEMVPMDLVEERLLDALHVLIGPEHPHELAVAAVVDTQKGERLLLLHTGLEPELLKQVLDTADLPPLFRPRERDAHQVDTLPVLGTGKRDLKGLKALAATLMAGSPADG